MSESLRKALVLEELMFVQLVKDFPASCEPIGSLPCSQACCTWRYPETDEWSSYLHMLRRKISGSCLDSREYGHRDPSRWPRDTLYPQKLALTSPTSGGRSVGIVRSRTHATEFSFFLTFSWINWVKRFKHSVRRVSDLAVSNQSALEYRADALQGTRCTVRQNHN
jgi:hypothetical protein